MSSTPDTTQERRFEAGKDGESIGDLMRELSQQTTSLVRDEIALARAEVSEKGKQVGIGAGLFGGAGVVALFGVGALVAAAIAGLALVVATWLSALIVGAVLLIVAGGLALTGKQEIAAAMPPVPQDRVESVQRDVQETKDRAKEGRR